MYSSVSLYLFFLVVVLLCGCRSGVESTTEVGDPLYQGFQQPPAEARPFVRWWWNGNQISAPEIRRQLEVLSTAGIGGVEINPIEMPPDAVDVGLQAIPWLSPQWNTLVKEASREAKVRGMITDLIVGSGWPFGGEFVKESELIERVLTEEITLIGPSTVSRNIAATISAIAEAHRGREPEPHSNDLLFAHLMPSALSSVSEVVDLTPNVDDQYQLKVTVPPGHYKLIVGVKQTGHREVMFGAPGAAGPVMNHYDANVVRSYLSRLKKIEQDTGVPLSELVRALFCDSIELAGANWTPGLTDVFKTTYGYDLEPYFAFVFYPPQSGYPPVDFADPLRDEIARVRYDYNRLLVDLFLKNFTKEFSRFCTENNLLSRYQAYGTPFLMGMVEGNMIPDIPESNNWIFSANMDTSAWLWNKGHGYMIWNMYAASGGHLMGRKIISCEAMTNTRGVFKMTLEDMKQADDMNFITGINHTVLHGYNYSPVEAGFPGWIRFGAYFNEKNTWWPYLKKWSDYNARLSYIFQESTPVKQFAVLGPTADLWSTRGLIRVPFHTQPWYLYELWQTFSQCGSSVEYVNETVIRAANKDGALTYGPMRYNALILADLNSLEPSTAQAILQYVESGGTLVVVGSKPTRSLSLVEAARGNAEVNDIFEKLASNFPSKVFFISPPNGQSELLQWTGDLLKLIQAPLDVDIQTPDPDVYQVHYRNGDDDIFFFTNTHRTEEAVISAGFFSEAKSLWRWDPESGERHMLLYDPKQKQLRLELEPLESALLVFSNEQGTLQEADRDTSEKKIHAIEGPWQLSFHHVDGRNFYLTSDSLFDLATASDTLFQNFAGEIEYNIEFAAPEKDVLIDLGDVNRGITEVLVNGKSVGVKWYGKHRYDITQFLLSDKNQLTIKYRGTLANYCRSLKNNPSAQRWAGQHDLSSMGIEGPVTLITSLQPVIE